MPVCIAFHDGADGHLGSDMLLKCPEIVAQRGERNLSPVRTGVGSGEYRLAEQDGFIIARRSSGCVDHAATGDNAQSLSKLPTRSDASIRLSQKGDKMPEAS